MCAGGDARRAAGGRRPDASARVQVRVRVRRVRRVRARIQCKVEGEGEVLVVECRMLRIPSGSIVGGRASQVRFSKEWDKAMSRPPNPSQSNVLCKIVLRCEGCCEMAIPPRS